MPKRYQVADLSVGGNTIKVSVTVEADGSLTILDLSYGPAADACYGEDRDVEHQLTISPEAVNQLSEHLFGRVVNRPAGEVAKQIAAMYEGDSGALRKIQEMLDQKEIRYDQMLWT